MLLQLFTDKNNRKHSYGVRYIENTDVYQHYPIQKYTKQGWKLKSLINGTKNCLIPCHLYHKVKIGQVVDAG